MKTYLVTLHVKGQLIRDTVQATNPADAGKIILLRYPGASIGQIKEMR